MPWPENGRFTIISTKFLNGIPQNLKKKMKREQFDFCRI
jgi:hypothetical protein